MSLLLWIIHIGQLTRAELKTFIHGDVSLIFLGQLFCIKLIFFGQNFRKAQKIFLGERIEKHLIFFEE